MTYPGGGRGLDKCRPRQFSGGQLTASAWGRLAEAGWSIRRVTEAVTEAVPLSWCKADTWLIKAWRARTASQIMGWSVDRSRPLSRFVEWEIDQGFAGYEPRVGATRVVDRWTPKLLWLSIGQVQADLAKRARWHLHVVTRSGLGQLTNCSNRTGKIVRLPRMPCQSFRRSFDPPVWSGLLGVLGSAVVIVGIWLSHVRCLYKSRGPQHHLSALHGEAHVHLFVSITVQ
ncbi:hypothetical protein B0H66DRAFT_538960 [Apodospora peruviana]|uniref:Uncharacterized protein n=1 Tax=Apodospora peruviana TaxID=516989 RepID=A0AAE0LXZ2_9PEZI|nr:hypothetical protein B0H66DRAFT_538960 [Apodospora peruviana]